MIQFRYSLNVTILRKEHIMAKDNLKLTPGSVNKEIIDKIKLDASRQVPEFLTPETTSKKVKESTEKKVVTKARQVKAPK